MKLSELKQGDTFTVALDRYTITGYTKVDGRPFAKCVKVWNGAPMLISVEIEIERIENENQEAR